MHRLALERYQGIITRTVMANRSSNYAPKKFSRTNRAAHQENCFQDATVWPSKDHCVVKFIHTDAQPPFNLKELVAPHGTLVRFHTQEVSKNTHQTRVEMENYEQASKLWKSCKENLIWGVNSVDPDYYYKIRVNTSARHGKEKVYQEYWSKEKLDLAIANKTVVVGPIRINPKFKRNAYLSDASDGKDILIPEVENRNRAFDGDLVAVELVDIPRENNKDNNTIENVLRKMNLQSSQQGNSPPTTYAAAAAPEPVEKKTGRVVAILKENRSRVATGYFNQERDIKNFAFFQPFLQNFPCMLVPLSMVEEARRKQDISNVIFACKVTEWRDDSKWPKGELCHIVGEKGEIEPETKRILMDCEVDDTEFSQAVIDCLPLTGQQWKIDDGERAKRRDFTKDCVFSIDPPHARDLDDALHCKRTADGNYEVGVHIADVSHFVKPQTELDNVASQRATSTYLIQRVIPMLPRLLCEQLCSLNPDVERLAFSVVWTMTKEGKILKEWFGRSIIRSCAKLSYDHAQAIIDGREMSGNVEFPPISKNWSMKDLREKTLDLFTISQNLRSKRMDAGALRLDQVRLSYTLDQESGLPNGCYTYDYKKSNELIEEFMLLANMAVAHQLYRKLPQLAFLRCHPSPKENMLDDLVHQCRAIGLEIDASSSKKLSKSLQTCCGNDELSKYRKNALFMLAIKPQKLAAYLCTGVHGDPDEYHHYALNVPLYTHFTSPIRRYADVVVHRQLAYTLGDKDDVQIMGMDADVLEEQAKTCNHKKMNAKTAGELSTDLFFKLFVKSFGPLHGKGIVMAILDHGFDVLSMDFGVIKRIYVEHEALNSFEFSQKDSPLGNQKLDVMKMKWPARITKNTPPIGLSPPSYNSVRGIEQELEVFSVVDIYIKEDSCSDGYKVLLKVPEEVLVEE